jgi:hypothetical protein
MIVLPVVDRELRVAARRPATYRTRLWAALAAMGVVAAKRFAEAWLGASAASQGRSLFFGLASLAFVYCLFIGARVTSDCISEEKREGTLGLLFLTDLGGVDVVLGKLVASSVNSFYGLLSVLPLLAMPLLLGGVTLAEFGKVVVTLLNALFFSLSVGVLVSALSRNERKAMMATALAVVSPAFIPFAVVFFMAVVLEVFTPSSFAMAVPFLMANPVFAFLLSLPTWLPPFIPVPPWSFWVSIALVHAFSWLALLITAVLLPLIWKDRAHVRARIEAPSLSERWRVWAFGTGHQRELFRTMLIERNPFLWLVSRDRLKPAYAWFFVLSMIAVWIWGYYNHQDVMFDFYPLVPTVMLIHCFLKVWVVSEVSHRLVEDQRNGALELLLSTPLTVRKILEGQQLALLRQFAGPLLLLASLELLVFRKAFSVAVLGPVLMMLILDLWTLFWVGMRFSLSARSINEVLLKSLFFVLALPWFVCLGLWPLFESAWSRFGPGYGNIFFGHRVWFWFVVGLVTDLILVLAWARPQLLGKSDGSAARSKHTFVEAFVAAFVERGFVSGSTKSSIKVSTKVP